MNCLEKHFKGSIEQNYPGRNLIISRTANVTRAINGPRRGVRLRGSFNGEGIRRCPKKYKRLFGWNLFLPPSFGFVALLLLKTNARFVCLEKQVGLLLSADLIALFPNGIFFGSTSRSFLVSWSGCRAVLQGRP